MAPFVSCSTQQATLDVVRYRYIIGSTPSCADYSFLWVSSDRLPCKTTCAPDPSSISQKSIAQVVHPNPIASTSFDQTQKQHTAPISSRSSPEDRSGAESVRKHDKGKTPEYRAQIPQSDSGESSRSASIKRNTTKPIGLVPGFPISCYLSNTEFSDAVNALNEELQKIEETLSRAGIQGFTAALQTSKDMIRAGRNRKRQKCRTYEKVL